jgi:hypothetical protein
MLNHILMDRKILHLRKHGEKLIITPSKSSVQGVIAKIRKISWASSVKNDTGTQPGNPGMGAIIIVVYAPRKPLAILTTSSLKLFGAGQEGDTTIKMHDGFESAIFEK